MSRLLRAAFLLAVTAGCRSHLTREARSSDNCVGVGPDTSERVALPGRAFHAIATGDACWVFVSMHAGPDSTGAGVAVVKRTSTGASLVRTVPGPRVPRYGVFGMALTHDQRILIVGSQDRLSFYDVARLTSPDADPLLGSLRLPGSPPGYFHTVVTSNDRYAFVSNHAAQTISVIDLATARDSGFRDVPVRSRIATGFGPGSLALSADGRFVYATSQIADGSWRWPNVCRAPGAPATAAPNHAQGAVHVIDVSRAISEPSRAIIATARAGCDPVRVVLAPATNRLFVTARGDNALLSFDADRLLTDTSGAGFGSLPLPTGPVGLAVLREERRVVVANARRFSAQTSDPEVLTIVDATPPGGATATIGRVPLGGGPVDLSLTRDGRYLLVANFEPQALTIMSVARSLSR